MPAGSFIINSTDHFTEEGINDIEPIVSDDNLVLSPQTVAAFTGPGAASVCVFMAAFRNETHHHIFALPLALNTTPVCARNITLFFFSQ